MLLNLSDVLSDRHQTINETVQLDMEEFQTRTGTYSIIQKDPVMITVSHMKKREYRIQAKSKICVLIPCDRCLEDVEQEIEHSIVYVENGSISGRQVGDGPSRIVLETLKRDPSRIHDRLSYLTKTESGQILKSSTMYVRGDDDNIEYIFALNYDITSLLTVENALHSLITTESELELEGGDGTSDGGLAQPQKITHNVNELLDSLIEQALALVGKPVAAMNKDDKVKVVQFLNNAGAFLITKSGDKVASLLGISKFTLYNYMDAANK